jgi:hypothetical protein
MRNQSMAPSRNSRRLTLLDLMIAVAGLTIGLWIMPHGVIPAAETAFPVITGPYAFSVKAEWLSILIVHFAYPFAVIWSLTVLVLAITPPCPPVRMLVRQPGFLACCAVGMTALITGPLSFAISQKIFIAGLPASMRLQIYLGEALTFRRGEGGFAVASAWLVLWANGRWRSQQSWADRLGRLLGLFWVLTIPFAWPVARSF